uniref:Ubiquitin-like protease family profile domain-containing protein n=1 Tax=Ditylenchus dipsaci TaxID=166011 RepID=A0A915DH11_9BILA
MDEQTLSKILYGCEHIEKCFLDVFLLTSFLQIPSTLICNLDPSYLGGSHWVVLACNDPSTIFYFDSLALEPNEFVKQHLQRFPNVKRNVTLYNLLQVKFVVTTAFILCICFV